MSVKLCQIKIPRDIGCGDTRKVFPLLSLLDQRKIPIQYYGLDLSLDALRSNISNLAASFKHVQCHGLWGTFDNARRYASTLSPASSPRWFLSLGSILGNDFPTPAANILCSWASILRPADRILLGMDATQSRARIWRSYHDPAGLFEKFMRGGLAHSNRVLGHAWYRPEDWEVAGAMSNEHVMHRFVFRARTHVRCEVVGLDFPPGHEIDCYEAFKYGPGEMARQFEAAELRQLCVWKAPEPSSIYEYLLEKETAPVVEDDRDATLSQAQVRQ